MNDMTTVEATTGSATRKEMSFDASTAERKRRLTGLSPATSIWFHKPKILPTLCGEHHIRRAAPAHSVVSNRIRGWRRPCEAALRS